jgi:NodT family efflux transporter outer membrane factor (OMF) lipoprotein
MRLLPLLPVAVSSLLALAACTAGPDYRAPQSPANGTAFMRANDAVSEQAPAVARWWTQLGDPALDTLEARALAADPGLAAAQARVKQARAGLRLERADRLPKGNASALYVHAQLPGLDLSSSDDSGSSGSDGGDSDSLNFYNLGFDASWEVDLWGGGRRRVEATRAQLGAAEANRADAQVSLTADVAQAYVALRERQQRLALLGAAVDRRRATLTLVEQRRQQGAASAIEVEQQRDEVEQAQAALLPVIAERDAYLNALATLLGEAPGALDAMLAASKPIPLPPASVAIGDPAALLARRPDIRAAERQLAKATAQIGVAQSARFPRLSFMGLIGIGGTHPGDLLDLDKLAGLAVPQLSWSFLDFGRSAARVEQVKDAREEAEANYRQAVLAALRDCEDALSHFGAQRQGVASAGRSRASAQRTAALTQQRLQAGTASQIQLLDAEIRSLAAQQAEAQATAAMTMGFIALQKALGLGWQ